MRMAQWVLCGGQARQGRAIEEGRSGPGTDLQQDIAWREVAVHNVLCMDVLQPRGNVLGDLQDGDLGGEGGGGEGHGRGRGRGHG